MSSLHTESTCNTNLTTLLPPKQTNSPVYNFVRRVLEASDTIDNRRAATNANQATSEQEGK